MQAPDQALDKAVGRYTAGAVECFADHGVGRAGRCVLQRPAGGSACTGSTDVAEIEAACAQPQRQAVPAGEAAVAVAAGGEIGADGAGIQQPAGGVCEHRHGDVEGYLFSGRIAVTQITTWRRCHYRIPTWSRELNSPPRRDTVQPSIFCKGFATCRWTRRASKPL